MPTDLEAGLLGSPPGTLRICGFGLAAAGAGAAAAMAELRPDRAVLLGAAGTYDRDRAPVGSAVVAGTLRCVGIGAGERTAAELGFAPADVVELGEGPEVLSVATASASPAEASARSDQHPHAVAEEMEGYAVALAATAFAVPLTVIRGISNEAGDRDHASWRLADAMAAAERAAHGMLRA